MADALLMDRMFQRIVRGLVDTGSAPHYAELARALGLGVEQGRLLLHDVTRAYPIGWLHPETDYIASFPPLNNLPTQYRITVRGAQRSEEGFIGLAELAGFFATESRHHMLDADYLSNWYPRRAAERGAYLERIGKTSPFWLGTPDPTRTQ
jgi:hypothetical protein